MANFYDDPMDENGNYHYGHFDEYFIDPKRKAYFIYSDDKLAKAIKSALAKEHEK